MVITSGEACVYYTITVLLCPNSFWLATDSILAASVANAANFELVIGFDESYCFGLFFKFALYGVAFFERYDFAAAYAGRVVMVFGEGVAEFKFVFPAYGEALDNIERFEEFECAVDASSVGGVTHGFGNFADALGLPIE